MFVSTTQKLLFYMLFGLCACASETGVAQKAPSTTTPVPEARDSDRSGDSPLSVVGCFTNAVGDGEHTHGFSVEIWKQENKIYGLISGSFGLRLSGDPPTGVLEKVVFDPVSRRFSFSSKLSIGKSYDENVKAWVSSRDVYEFAGFLNDNKVEGKLKVTDTICEKNCSEMRKVILKRSQSCTSRLHEFRNYKDWEVAANEILERLGPKW